MIKYFILTHRWDCNNYNRSVSTIHSPKLQDRKLTIQLFRVISRTHMKADYNAYGTVSVFYCPSTLDYFAMVCLHQNKKDSNILNTLLNS